MVILPTQNKKWGFWSKTGRFLKRKDQQDIWNTASMLVARISGLTPVQVRCLLDSKFGWLLACNLATEIQKGRFEVIFLHLYSKSTLRNAYHYYVGILGE